MPTADWPRRRRRVGDRERSDDVWHGRSLSLAPSSSTTRTGSSTRRYSRPGETLTRPLGCGDHRLRTNGVLECSDSVRADLAGSWCILDSYAQLLRFRRPAGTEPRDRGGRSRGPRGPGVGRPRRVLCHHGQRRPAVFRLQGILRCLRGCSTFRDDLCSPTGDRRARVRLVRTHRRDVRNPVRPGARRRFTDGGPAACLWTALHGLRRRHHRRRADVRHFRGVLTTPEDGYGERLHRPDRVSKMRATCTDPCMGEQSYTTGCHSTADRASYRGAESDDVAVGIDDHALVLPPLSVFWETDIGSCRGPGSDLR